MNPVTAQERPRRFPYRIVMEPRLEPAPSWMSLLILLGTVAVALLLGAVILALVGGNPRAAQYAGIPIVRNTIFVIMFSGGLAGLAGVFAISGVVHRFQGTISPGCGFACTILFAIIASDVLLRYRVRLVRVQEA